VSSRAGVRRCLLEPSSPTRRELPLTKLASSAPILDRPRVAVVRARVVLAAAGRLPVPDRPQRRLSTLSSRRPSSSSTPRWRSERFIATSTSHFAAAGSGHPPSTRPLWLKAGLAALFAYHEAKIAVTDAQSSPLLSKLVAPLTALQRQLSGLSGRLKSGVLDATWHQRGRVDRGSHRCSERQQLQGDPRRPHTVPRRVTRRR